MFKEDGTIMHFKQPKGEYLLTLGIFVSLCCRRPACTPPSHSCVPSTSAKNLVTLVLYFTVQAAFQSNTYVVNGTAEDKCT